MIRIFSGQLTNYLDLFFGWTGKQYYNTLWYWYEALEGEKYGWTFCANVGMECKLLGTEGEGFEPNFSFHISLSTLQHTEVKMLTKIFWSTL